MALTEQDKCEMLRKFCEGRSCEQMAKLYSISGQYVRRLANENDWKSFKSQYQEEFKKQAEIEAMESAKRLAKESVRHAEKETILEKKKPVVTKYNNAAKPKIQNNVAPASTARQLALLEAKSPDNFGKDNPIVREFVLDELRKGVSISAACRSVGIDPKTLKYWRSKDDDFDQRCNEAQGDFVSGLERMATGVTTPDQALRLLERHPLTKAEWSKQEDKHTIKIEFAYNRHGANVVDAEFERVEDAPQIESPRKVGD